VRREHLTPKNEFEHDVKRDVEARVREGVKAILEEVLEEEMTQHLKAGYGSSPPTRRGERNGHYTRNLLTQERKIERLEVEKLPRCALSPQIGHQTRRFLGSWIPICGRYQLNTDFLNRVDRFGSAT
jgi:putative transposase